MNLKKTMRRSLVLGAVLLLLLTLFACGVGETDTSSETTTSLPPETSTSTKETIEETTEKSTPSVGNPSAIGASSDIDSTLPSIYIDTDSGDDIVSRDEYITAKISLSGTADDEVFGFTDSPADVRCRGNYTYTATEKKSYRLKFDEKINLFGQGKGPAKSWVLLANHCDQSFLRNHVAFTLGNNLSNISYCSSSSFVKLYVNGEYYGIYQVAEQHQVNEYRVNIDEDPDTVDTDYLIERDSYAEDSATMGLDCFRVNRVKYRVHSDNMTEEKCSFLADYIQKAHDAIKGGNRFQVMSYIDVDSFIDTFILQALLKNTDIGFSSFFMVKKAGGKLYFTCPWDFDLSLGNDERLDGGDYEGLYVGAKHELDQQHEWFYLLMNQDWFCDRLLARWNEVKDTLYTAAVSEIDRIYTCFGDEIETNFDVWDIFGQKINQEPWQIQELSSYEAHVMYLKAWFQNRYVYLDSLLNSDELYNQGGQEDWHPGWGGW